MTIIISSTVVIIGVINFNGILIHQGLFYARSLGNRVHLTFILTFLCTCSYRILKVLNRSIWTIDWTLTGIATTGQSSGNFVALTFISAQNLVNFKVAYWSFCNITLSDEMTKEHVFQYFI